MGTRNIITITADNKLQLAHQCMSDGYPEGQGIKTLKFLRDEMEQEKFLSSLRNCYFLTKGKEKKLELEYNAELSYDNKKKMYDEHPGISKHNGADILGIIQATPDGLELANNHGFKRNPDCEWSWDINFDKGTFTGTGGRKKVKFLLNALPTDEIFLAAF